jgi:hypothetical protein
MEKVQNKENKGGHRHFPITHSYALHISDHFPSIPILILLGLLLRLFYFSLLSQLQLSFSQQ